MPQASLEALEQNAARVRFYRGPLEVAPGVVATGEIPQPRPGAPEGADFCVDGACREPDPFVDEQALLIRTGRGLVVLTGCAHAGLPATLEHCRRLGGAGVFAVFVGFHLAKAIPAVLEAAVAALAAAGVALIGPCHCTGQRGREVLEARLPGRVRDVGCGFLWRL
ncbi:MAG: MBL fold metallo-hydrolase [Bryobacteraceae bacterium]